VNRIASAPASKADIPGSPINACTMTDLDARAEHWGAIVAVFGLHDAAIGASVVTMVEDIVMTDQDQRYPRVVTIIEGNHGREERSATF